MWHNMALCGEIDMSDYELLRADLERRWVTDIVPATSTAVAVADDTAAIPANAVQAMAWAAKQPRNHAMGAYLVAKLPPAIVNENVVAYRNYVDPPKHWEPRTNWKIPQSGKAQSLTQKIEMCEALHRYVSRHGATPTRVPRADTIKFVNKVVTLHPDVDMRTFCKNLCQWYRRWKTNPETLSTAIAAVSRDGSGQPSKYGRPRRMRSVNGVRRARWNTRRRLPGGGRQAELLMVREALFEW